MSINHIDSCRRRDPNEEAEAAKRAETAPPSAEKTQKQSPAASPRYTHHPSQDAAIAAFVKSVQEQIGIGVTDVKADHDKDGVIRVEGRAYDLSTAKGCEGFTAVLRQKGIPSEQADHIMRVIGNAPASTRDELAALALTWSAAERGGLTQRNLSIEAGVRHVDVWALAEAMPRAAAQIERVQVHGDAPIRDEVKNGSWRYAFPSLQKLEAVSRFERSTAVRV